MSPLRSAKARSPASAGSGPTGGRSTASKIDLRIYRGSEEQPVDPLIAAKQGAGNTPAYRGTAFVVVERFALADYGNRIPQFQFEVLRPVGSAMTRLRAVSLIPGATEYGLSPALVTRQKRQGETEAVNRHVLHEAQRLRGVARRVADVLP